MAQRLALWPWMCASEIESVRRTLPSWHKDYHTGIFLHAYGGWEWYSATGRNLRTDQFGEGLWLWSNTRNEWVQERGTCQFSLPSNRRAAIRTLRRLRYTIATNTVCNGTAEK